MPKRKLILFLFAISLTAFLLVYISIGNSLKLNEKEIFNPELLFTFGMEPKRYEYSRTLVEQYNINRWLISDPIDYVGKRLEADKSFKQDHISFSHCQSTFAEVIYLSSYLKKNPPKQSVVLISSSWHLKRIEYLVSKYIDSEHHPNIVLKSVPDSLMNYPDHFYSQWYKFSNLHFEIGKILFYWIYY
jgi:uncharacterized SAM-binding protein YcdF (DUF218 family)